MKQRHERSAEIMRPAPGDQDLRRVGGWSAPLAMEDCGTIIPVERFAYLPFLLSANNYAAGVTYIVQISAFASYSSDQR